MIPLLVPLVNCRQMIAARSGGLSQYTQLARLRERAMLMACQAASVIEQNIACCANRNSAERRRSVSNAHAGFYFRRGHAGDDPHLMAANQCDAAGTYRLLSSASKMFWRWI